MSKNENAGNAREGEPYDTTIADLAERDAPVAPDTYQHTRYPWDELRYETAVDF